MDIKILSFSLIFLLLISSCCSDQDESNSSVKERDTVIQINTMTDTVYLNAGIEGHYSYYFQEKLPDWLVKMTILNGDTLGKRYVLDERLNPFYLEEDFNGDGIRDVALLIREIDSEKAGFAIVHGGSGEVFIIGAGVMIKNGLSDDMEDYNIWKVNRNKINEAGLEEYTGTGPQGELILSVPSLQIARSEVGGGLIYWNGKEYAYFHQTC